MARLSAAMVAMLRSAADGNPFSHLNGASESRRGGAERTWQALVNRGLLEWPEDERFGLRITDAGRKALTHAGTIHARKDG